MNQAIMKKMIISLTVLIIGVRCFCQRPVGSQSISTDYLQKSKHQKTVAWVLLSGGAAIVTVGALIPHDDKGIDDIYNSLTKDMLYVTGGLSMLGSIPLFIASGKNKRRALAVSANFQMQKSQVIRRAAFADKSYSAVAVKLNF